MKDRSSKSTITLETMKIETTKLLEQRGVNIEDIADIVYTEQVKYNPSITVDYCIGIVSSILEKREVIHIVQTGITLDILVEKGLINQPLSDVIKNDEGLYGVDETLGQSIASLYGTIGFSNFGYFDKVKPGIIGKLDNSSDQVNTYLDDLVCGIAAASCGKLAHNSRELLF